MPSYDNEARGYSDVVVKPILETFCYSKTCLKRPLKIDTNVLKTGGSLIQVESIAECSKWAFCNTFDLN